MMAVSASIQGFLNAMLLEMVQVRSFLLPIIADTYEQTCMGDC
jgi:hypothetical protein